MGKGVAEGDAGRAGFDEFAGARAIKHAGLGSHDGSSLYTGGREREVESRKLKVERKNRRQRFSETVAARSGRRGTRSSRKNSHRGAQGKKKGTARNGCPTRACLGLLLGEALDAAGGVN